MIEDPSKDKFEYDETVIIDKVTLESIFRVLLSHHRSFTQEEEDNLEKKLIDVYSGMTIESSVQKERYHQVCEEYYRPERSVCIEETIRRCSPSM